MSSNPARRPGEAGANVLPVVRIGNFGVAPASFNGIAGLSLADDLFSLQPA